MGLYTSLGIDMQLIVAEGGRDISFSGVGTGAYAPGNKPSFRLLVLVRVSIAVMRRHGHSNSYKGKYLTETGLQSGGLVHCHHGRKHGSMQVDMVLKKYLGVL